MNPIVTNSLFFLSGCAALIFESVWFRLAGVLFGNSVMAGATVVAAFMAGLAVGAWAAARTGDRIERPLAFYAWVEIAIGLTGVAVTWLLPALSGGLSPLLEPLIDQPLALTAIRFTAAFALLVLPSFAIGMTLPLFVRALNWQPHLYGPDLGRLYAFNTLGAVSGALLFDLLLLEPLGIRGSALCAMTINLLVAMACLALDGRTATKRVDAVDSDSATATRSATGIVILSAAFLSGAALLALEIIWFRVLLLEVRGTGTVFAILLAVVLAAIAIGGGLGGLLLRWRPAAGRNAVIAAFAAGALSVLGYALLPVHTGLASAGMDEWQRALAGALYLMAPTALMSGLLFTQLATALRALSSGSAAATGRIVALNTLGAMLGAPLAGFVLLPLWGMQTSLWVIAALYGVIAMLLWLPRGFDTLRSHVSFGSAALLWLLALMLFPWPNMTLRLDAATAPWRALDGSKTVYQREGLIETIQLLRSDLAGQPVAWRLVTDNVSMSNTERDSRRYMQLFAFLPMAMHPTPDDVLLISYGTGSTAEALTRSPLPSSIDIVDISRETLATSALIYPQSSDNPLNDPRVTLFIEDGRNLLASRSKRYDVITGEPPPPRLARIVNLYTKEFFEQVHQRLKDGGVTSYWLPVDQLDAGSSRAILAGFCAVFRNCALWAGSNYNWIMTGSRGDLPRASVQQVHRLWQHPASAAQLQAIGVEQPAQLLSNFIADAATLHDWIGGQLPLTDNFPRRLRDRNPDGATLHDYAALMDDVTTQRRFENSRWIDTLWPEPLLRSAHPLFAWQPVVNNQVRTDWPGTLSMADQLLDAGLRVAPAWLLRSDVRRMQVASATGGSSDPDVLYHAAVMQLITDRPGVAASLFRAAFERGRPDAAGAAQLADCRTGRAQPQADNQPRVYRCRSSGD